MSHGFVEPDLFAFLQREIIENPRENLEVLAEEWAQRYDDPCTAGRLDRWFRSPMRMRPGDARRLLDLCNLGAKWEAERSQPGHLLIAPGAFDYASIKFGRAREMSLDALVAEGVDFAAVMRQVVQIDVDLFRDLIASTTDTSRWVGEIDDWLEMFRSNPETWRVWLSDSGQVLAYWNWANPEPRTFSRAIAGDYPETEITLASVLPVGTAEPVNIYGPALYVRADIHDNVKQWLGHRIIASFLYHLKRLERAGVRFAEICTPVATTEGRRWAERFELSRMPDEISHRYAARMGWKVGAEPDGRLLPAIYVGRVDDVLRRRAGLETDYRVGARSPDARNVVSS